MHQFYPKAEFNEYDVVATAALRRRPRAFHRRSPLALALAAAALPILALELLALVI